jgi:exopolysaccharide biosynthesis polyprenyl glycosylphosphotransferase
LVILWKHSDQNILNAWDIEKIISIIFFVISINLSSFYIFGLYDPRPTWRPESIFLSIVIASAILILIYSTLSFFIIFLRPGRLLLLIFTGLTAVLTFIWRVIFLKYIKIEPQKVLIIGRDKTSSELYDILTKQFPYDYKIIEHWHRSSHNPTLPNLYETVQEKKIDLIIFSVHSQILGKVTEPLINLRFKQKNICEAHNFYQFLTGKFPIQHLTEFWMLINSRRESYFPQVEEKLKRAFDIFFALILSLLSLPVVLIAALAIKLNSSGPVFFIQERLGKNEVPFRLIKLRTMINNAEELTGPQWSSENDPRITRVGKILRKFRLDELPQLINILKGEMSVIGPRPIRRHFADLLVQEIPYYRLRFLGKPGVTGWAQVNHDYAGSNGGQAEKLQYDLFYLVHQSMLIDLLILLKTIRVMFWAKGT